MIKYKKHFSVIVFVIALFFVGSPFALGMLAWILFFFIVSFLSSKKAILMCDIGVPKTTKVVELIVDMLINMSSVRFVSQKADEKVFINE